MSTIFGLIAALGVTASSTTSGAVVETATTAATSVRSSTVAADSAPAPKKKKEGLRWYAVPNFAFDTDDGFGAGARAELAEDAEGHDPYRAAYMIHLFLTTRGYHHHRIRWDRVGFGPEGRLRFTAHLAWRAWLNDGYFGIGNGTTRERAFVGDFGDDDPARKRYNYSLRQPFAHFTLRAKLDGGLQLYGALDLKYSWIDTYAGSLLGEQRPFGIDGGFGGQLLAGVIYDTRVPEIGPREGVMLELGARAQPPLPGGAGEFVGVLASARGFTSLGSRVVLAGRLMAELLAGEIPFYDLVHWGGAQPIAGFGGSETLRGIRFGRFRAPGKAILNTEVRIDVLRHTLFGDPFLWEIVPYADAGLVFAAGDLATGPQAGWPIHPAFGAGIRAVYADAFVGRIDAGYGLDPVREPDGRVTEEATLGFYVVFEHAF